MNVDPLKVGFKFKIILRSRKRFSNQFPSKFPKDRDYTVSNTKSKMGRGTSSPHKKQTCRKCRKKHYGDCIVGTENRFMYGKCGY